MQNAYPYEEAFIKNCKVNGLSNTSIKMANQAISNFWKYYIGNSNDEANVNNVKSSDVREYLNQLDMKEHLQTRTLNKYLTYLKKYFSFLASYRYISSFPLFDIKGKPFQRNLTVIIDWMDQIPSFLELDLHSDTIKLLLLISLGYEVSDLLSVRWNEIANNINDKQLKKYVVDHLNFENFRNPTIFQSRKKGDKLISLETVMHRIRQDQDKISLPLVPKKLRQSYVLSVVSNSTLNDEQLKKKLRINDKSISYYRFCASYYTLIKFKI